MMDRKECDTGHLRDYPDCYEECEHDKCVGKQMTQDKPTEARQDELAGIREKIAKNIYFDGVEYAVGTIAEVTWREAPRARRDKYLERADQILSLTVSSGGGKCPECKGEKKILNHSVYDYWMPCHVCNGTGQKPIVTKTLGQLAKEHQDG